MKPNFSIITITKNDRTGFEKTMRSVQSQTCRDFEWIVIDGGSTDGTLDLIRENAKDITKWCTGKDTGLYNAMNIGTDMATGDYLIYMNGGDTFANADTLKLVADTANKENYPDIIYGDNLYGKHENGSTRYIRAKSQYTDIVPELPTCHQALYFKRSFVGNNRYDEKFKICSDYDFFLNLTVGKNYTKKIISHPLAFFDNTGISSKSFKIIQFERLKIQSKYFGYEKAAKNFLKTTAAAVLMKRTPKLHRFICDACHIVKPHKQVIMPENVPEPSL